MNNEKLASFLKYTSSFLKISLNRETFFNSYLLFISYLKKSKEIKKHY